MDAEKLTSERIVIVGGGVSGLSLAVRLAQANLPVTVLERSHLGGAASTRNQGWLQSGGWFAPQSTQLARFCYESMKQTLRFCPECLEPQHDGMAYLFSDPETEIDRWTTAWEEASIPYRKLDLADVFSRLPDLAQQEVHSAFLLPDRAMRTDTLLTRLATTAKNLGAEVRTLAPVVRLNCCDCSVRSVTIGTGEEVAAGLVILAGGTEGLGLCPEYFSPEAGRQAHYTIVALKAHLVAITPGLGPLPFCVVDAQGFNHVPHLPTSVLGIDRWRPVTNPTDQHVEPAEIEQIWKRFERFFPRRRRDELQVTELAGTTVQAMHVEQVEPGNVPLPTVIDHAEQTPSIDNLVSLFPGRATLWPHVAERAHRLVLKKLRYTPLSASPPPWAVSD